jgi:hypothetical protein
VLESHGLIYLQCEAELRVADPRKVYTDVMQLLRKAGVLHTDVYRALKRYLKVKLINHGFPLATHRDRLLHTWLACVMTTLQMVFLSALEALQGPLDTKKLCRVIYQVERSLVHNTRIEDTIERDPRLHALEQYTPVFLDIGQGSQR